MEQKQEERGRLTVTFIGKRRVCKYSALWRGYNRKPPGEISPPGRAWHRNTDKGGGEGGRGRAPICTRIILLLYAQFQQSCMRNRTHSLSHFSFPSRKFVADPLNREILQSSVKRKEGSNCGENCRGGSAENCYREIATPFHFPCIFKSTGVEVVLSPWMDIYSK